MMKFILRSMLLGFIFCASQVSSAEIKMVCDRSEAGKKNYYKLLKPFFGKPNVKQKIEGQWKDWCRKDSAACEIYDSGAMQLYQREVSWEKDYPNSGIAANQSYLQLTQYWIDFEFGTRRKKLSLFTNDIPMKEITKYPYNEDTIFSCEIKEN